jgi:hypothetical protein
MSINRTIADTQNGHRKQKRTRRQKQLTSSKARSVLTNGRHHILGREVDGRSSTMRRYRDLIQLHVSDLGGEDLISESERRLIRRAAMLTLQCELLDAKFALLEGEASVIDLDRYQRASNSLRRLLQSLGLQRRAKDVTTLGDLLREDLRRQQEEAS